MIAYSIIGTDRIQLILDGKVYYIQDTPSSILEISEKIYKYNDGDESLKEEVLRICNNAPAMFYGDFKRARNGSVFFRDYAQEIPDSLGKRIEKAKEDRDEEALHSMEAFQTLNMLNVNPIARNDLYFFINYNGIPITPKGYFIGYKAVAPYRSQMKKSLKEFLRNNSLVYGPSDYLVRIDKEYKLLSYLSYHVGEDLIRPLEDIYPEAEKRVMCGTFSVLYDQLESEASGVFVDKHTKTIKQSVGDVVKMPRAECDGDPKRDCSYGLHVGNVDYVNMFASPGDGILICLVNPADVIAVPSCDARKMRVCQYYICGFSDLDENGKIIPLDDMKFEDDYATFEKAQIEKELKEGNFEKYVENDSDTAASLDEIQEIIKNRLEIVS